MIAPATRSPTPLAVQRVRSVDGNTFTLRYYRSGGITSAKGTRVRDIRDILDAVPIRPDQPLTPQVLVESGGLISEPIKRRDWVKAIRNLDTARRAHSVFGPRPGETT